MAAVPSDAVRIDSPSNPRVKGLVRLRSRRAREAEGRFLVEGAREVRRALDAGVTVETLYLCPDLGASPEDWADAGVPFVELSASAFGKAAYGRDGVLAVARCFPVDLGRIPWDRPGLFLLVADGIEKPGNLGAMLRTAAAAGAAGVVVADPTVDVFNPNVVRASTGALFGLAVGVATGAEVIERLRREGVRIFAAVTEGGDPPWDRDLTGRAAFVVGREDRGLSADWVAAADGVVTLPLTGNVDSLNAAVAAAVLLYEAVRQRSAL